MEENAQQQQQQTPPAQQQQTPPAPVQHTGGMQTLPDDGTMQTGRAGEAGAAVSTAEDTHAKMVEMQQRQIDQLIKQNESLQSQIGILLRNGASVTDEANQAEKPQIGNLTQEQFDYRNSEKYVSLAELGKQAGKRDYENVNSERKKE